MRVLPDLPPSAWHAVLLAACGRVDRWMLDHSIRRRPASPVPGLADRLARAETFYANPDFITKPETFFARPRGFQATTQRILPLPGGALDVLRYSTDFEPVFPEARTDAVEADNARGIALCFRHADGDRPTMLCVHGYRGGQFWLETFAFDALRFYRAGLDVVINVLPYHGLRCPAGSRHSGEAFFDMDIVRTNEAFARAVYELRSLLRYLRASGASSVGAFGMSLGGYTAALLASVEPRLDFVASMIPVVSFPDRWWCEGTDDLWLARAIEHGWTRERIGRITAVHEPLSRPALVPRARRLVIGARADGICTPAHAEQLWRHWDEPRLHWYAGGHLLQLGRTAAFDDVRRMLEEEGLLHPERRIARPIRVPALNAAVANVEATPVRRRAARRPA